MEVKEFFKEWWLLIVIVLLSISIIAYINRWFPFHNIPKANRQSMDKEARRKKIVSIIGDTSNLPPACEAWIVCDPSIQNCNRYWRACEIQLNNL